MKRKSKMDKVITITINYQEFYWCVWYDWPCGINKEYF